MNKQIEGRPGLVTVTFRQLLPEQIVGAASKYGLKVLEWGGDVHVPAGDINRARQVATLTRNAGLETICYGSYYRAGHEGEEWQPTFDDVLASAVALGAPSIRVWAGMRGSEMADEAYFSRVCGDAMRIADMAAAEGLRIAFEFHGGTLNDTAESSAKLLAALPHRNIDTLWQPLVSLDAAMQDRSLEVVLPRLAHIHVFHWLPGKSIDRRPLSEGVGAWSAWMSTMRAANRFPDALLEFVPGDRPSVLNQEASTLQSLLKTTAQD